MNKVRIGACVALVFIAAPAVSATAPRILHAETLNPVTQIVPRPGPEGPQGAASLSFFAYGRQFELELQPNRRLLSRLPAAQGNAPAGETLYRGQLRHQPKSWVRITRVGNELYGAIWDGAELYAIEPQRSVARFSWRPLDRNSSTPTVYRLSDVESPGVRYCGLAREDRAAQRATALSDYRALVGELTAQATLAELKQIEIGVLGDSQFRAAHAASDPSAVALARMNIVDGIFSEQVGVIIVVPEVRIFTTANNPFSTSKPSDLLNQLADYRNNDMGLRAHGLTHLMTGRDLDGDTAGIAYLNSLCAARSGAGLSEGWRGLMDAALIAAHEIGHNFGAPHDGEADSPCVNSSPQLMSPSLNGSQSFSQCSRDQMAPRIAAASCIRPAQVADIAVSAPALATAYPNEPFDYAIDVSSLATLPVQDATVSFSLFHGSLALDSATVTGGTCSSGAGIVTCQLGTIPPETTRRIQLRLRTFAVGTFTGTIEATASNDRTSANNRQTVQLQVLPRADAEVIVSPTAISALVGEPLAFSAIVRSRGIDAVDGVSVRITTNGIAVSSATVPGGSCSITSTEVNCSLGSLPAGTERQIDLQASGAAVSNPFVEARLSAANDGNFNNNQASLSISLRHDVDAELASGPLQHLVETRETLIAVTVRALGRRATRNVKLILPMPSGVTLLTGRVDGGACTLVDNTATCTLAEIEPDKMAPFYFEVRGETPGDFVPAITFTADEDTVASNNAVSPTFRVLPLIDVSMERDPGGTTPAVVGRALDVSMRVITSLRAAPAVQLGVSIPSFITVDSFQVGAGSCMLNSGQISCQLGDLPPNSNIAFTVRLRATTPNMGGSLSAVATTSLDVNTNNDRVFFSLQSLAATEVSLAGSATLSATAGQNFSYTLDARNTGTANANEVKVAVTLPAGVTYVSADLNSNCSATTAGFGCLQYNIDPGGTRRISATLRAASSGSYSVTATATATNDTDTQNNAQTTSVTVGAVTVTPPASSGGGGGGGGGVDWLLLCALAMLASLKSTRGWRWARHLQ